MIIRILLLSLLASVTFSQNDQNLDELIKEIFGPNGNTSPSPPVPTDNQGSGGNNIGQENTSKPERAVIQNEDGECTCVPYYLCPNGTVLTDGTGILDIRIKGICDEYMDICCKSPRDDDQPIKPVPIQRKGCGQRHPDGVGFRITGDNNNEAQFGEFPWMVALLMRSILEDGSDLMVYQCGGALIHENVVLTAAHCVSKKMEDSTELQVRGGEWDTQRTNEIFPHQNRKVVRVITHPGFQPANLFNDYALLVLDKPFDLVENIDTVCLPSPGVVPLSRECYASGWGKDVFGKKGQYQVILKKIDLPIVPKNQCINLLRKTRLGPYFRLHDSFVCAGGVIGKDTCKGDGGSPLVCPIEGKPGTYEVTGLVAWGIGCANETPGIYAGVAHVRNWIDKNMNELGFPIH